MLRSFQNVAGVAVLLKCCSVLKKFGKCYKDFQKKNVPGAAGLFDCCGDVANVRGFPRLEGNLRCCTCA